MSSQKKRKVTVVYYSDVSLELHHDVQTFLENKNGRIIIPDDYKIDKTIVMVCEGEINILNKIGDRIQMVRHTA